MFKIRLGRKNETVESTNCGDLRRCDQCGNVVTDPLVVQCPRCWTKLPGGGCNGCTGCSMSRAGSSC
jgi:hypothetical protein